MAGIDEEQADGGGARFRRNRHEYDCATGYEYYEPDSNPSSDAACQGFGASCCQPRCRQWDDEFCAHNHAGYHASEYYAGNRARCRLRGCQQRNHSTCRLLRCSRSDHH